MGRPASRTSLLISSKPYFWIVYRLPDKHGSVQSQEQRSSDPVCAEEGINLRRPIVLSTRVLGIPPIAENHTQRYEISAGKELV